MLKNCWACNAHVTRKYSSPNRQKWLQLQFFKMPSLFARLRQQSFKRFMTLHANQHRIPFIYLSSVRVKCTQWYRVTSGAYNYSGLHQSKSNIKDYIDIYNNFVFSLKAKHVEYHKAAIAKHNEKKPHNVFVVLSLFYFICIITSVCIVEQQINPIEVELCSFEHNSI